MEAKGRDWLVARPQFQLSQDSALRTALWSTGGLCPSTLAPYWRRTAPRQPCAMHRAGDRLPQTRLYGHLRSFRRAIHADLLAISAPDARLFGKERIRPRNCHVYLQPAKGDCAALFPRPACTTPVYSVAEYAANLLNNIAHRDFIDARCQNFSVLSRVNVNTPPLAEHFETMLHQRRFSFFDMRLIVADKHYFARTHPTVNSGCIHQATQKIELAIRVLDKNALHVRLDTLFLDTIKPSFDFTVLEDALFQLRLLYEKFAEVYLPERAAENREKFKPSKHLCIEMLNDWLLETFCEMIDCIAVTGEHLSLVVQRAVGIILREYGNPSLSLNYLSGQIGVSPSYLSRVFNREWGQSVPKTIEDTRLKLACNLMDETALSIIEIAS